MDKYLKYNHNCLISIDLCRFDISKSNFYFYLDFLNHPLLSGNKLRKLYGNIQYIQDNNISKILTVGGNYSNYIYAISQLPKLIDIEIHVLIKGYKPKSTGYTLQKLVANNISFDFCPKEMLDDRINTILSHDNSIYFIPEGGSNELSHLGFEPLIYNNFNDFDTICVSIGTQSSFNAIKKYKHPNTTLIGYVASKDYSISDPENKLVFDYHFGGFAKMNQELFEFAQDFNKQYNILLDPIYTAKMMYGIIQDYKLGRYTENEKIVAIHTGGLQGWEGMKERNILFDIKAI